MTDSQNRSYRESETPRLLPTVTLQGRALIPPGSLPQRVVMGNEASKTPPQQQHSQQQQQQLQQLQRQEKQSDHHRQRNNSHHHHHQQQQTMSNLSILMNQAGAGGEEGPSLQRQQSLVDEADSASGPLVASNHHDWLGTSAPEQHCRLSTGSNTGTRPRFGSSSNLPTHAAAAAAVGPAPSHVRRCISAKEIAQPLSGSPYSFMLQKKNELEKVMQLRLAELRQHPVSSDEASSTNSSLKRESVNERRNRIREEHYGAVVEDLCQVITDLFLAESKLLNASQYGVSVSSETQREMASRSIQDFIAKLPKRYALGADTPSEVLLHMRLMAAVRTDSNKAVVHVHNLDDDERWAQTRKVTEKGERLLRLVTIVCSDRNGLLEFISKLLATGGSRVLDADVMLSADGIALDRFVVEMNGRLRLDRFVDRIEDFLRDAGVQGQAGSATAEEIPLTPKESAVVAAGPMYFRASETPVTDTQKYLESEMKTAIPLSEMLAAPSSSLPDFLPLRKYKSMPPVLRSPSEIPRTQLQMIPRDEPQYYNVEGVSIDTEDEPKDASIRQRRPLVNRPASSNLDWTDSPDHPVEFVDVPIGSDSPLNDEGIPVIPFEELMLIETIGTGRVSTIYRAAWQQRDTYDGRIVGVQMVALKVAMINSTTGDTSNTEELRREADIAAQLRHPNICDLVGIAADSECFCLAYDFCEGGSLLQLLSDTSRYYEYLPIALDIANGMAYLHSRSVIHRDLKPSNILLTRDQRAKIADFGMSVANRGQELTGETGTYRYMAPEVIRHESYSSNADVYSFGICLWQLITREVPFATMTPIQTAYAVAEGQRPVIPPSTPRRLAEIIELCWDHDSYRRPSFTYIALALADYAKMAFSPANVGAQTLQIANETLATIDGNATINVDFTTPVAPQGSFSRHFNRQESASSNGENLGLEL